MLTTKRIIWKNVSRAYSKWIPPQKKKPILSQNAYNRFLKAFPVIIDNTLQGSDFLKCTERVKKIIEYNIRKKGHLHGEMIILCNEALQGSEQIGDELAYKQHVTAWCAELIFAYAVITDDFEDRSKTRYNKTCWHLLPEVGNLIINDSNIVQSFVYETLRRNFEGRPYIELLNLVNEVILKYNIGQNLDSTTQATKNYKSFTMDHFETVALLKLGFSTVIFPMQLALILSNKHNEESCRNVYNIFRDVGIWSQINNDFQDFFDDDARTGKTGADIQSGKCTWLAITALQRCNDAQRKDFEECYGSWEPSYVKRIRELYKELNIIDLYFEDEQTRYNNAVRKIEALPLDSTPSRSVFRFVLDKYYGNVSYKLKL